jgi:hypothetical protein
MPVGYVRLSSQCQEGGARPDGIGASTIHLFWEWDAAWVTILIRSAIYLRAHAGSCNIAKGITILKPGKPTYTTIKSYRVISLLNCFGKVMEKVVAEMLSIHCEGEGGGLHNGQYGCRKGRSTIDAVGMLLTHVQKAWAQHQVAAALCMDVEDAFCSVTWDCLARKMRKIGVDECLVMWMLDFMMERWVHMVVDGQKGQELAVTTGLPQGSAAGPILFAIHMYDLHE